MQYIFIAIVLMVLCVFGISCRKSPASSTSIKPSGPITNVASGTYLSRQDIEAQLAYIAKSPPPKELAIGAECYKVANPPNRIDYVCANCGEKTLFVQDSSDDPNTFQQQSANTIKVVQWELESCRRLVQGINNLDLELDESQFCKHCSPNAETPTLGLIVRYSNQPEPHRVWNIDLKDVLLIKGFTEGGLKFKGHQDWEAALIKSIPRLEELLGVKLDDTE